MAITIELAEVCCDCPDIDLDIDHPSIVYANYRAAAAIVNITCSHRRMCGRVEGDSYESESSDLKTLLKTRKEWLNR